MTGSIQNPHGFDLGITGLRTASQGEYFLGPLLRFVEGISTDHDPADDASASLVRGHGFNTIDFEHGFQTPTSERLHHHALMRWSFSNRLIRRSRFNFDNRSIQKIPSS